MSSCSGWPQGWRWGVLSSAWSLPDTGLDYDCSLGVCCLGGREAMVGASFKRGNKRPWDRPQGYHGAMERCFKMNETLGHNDARDMDYGLWEEIAEN